MTIKHDNLFIIKRRKMGFIDGPVGNSGFIGRALASNGNVIFAPYSAARVGIYNPSNNTYTQGIARGGSGTHPYQGCALALSGDKIVMSPLSSTTVGIYTVSTNTMTPVAHGITGLSEFFVEGVTASNGNVILVPYRTLVVGIVNPTNNTYTNGVAHGRGQTAFYGGCLSANQNLVIFNPYAQTRIGRYTVSSNTYADGVATNGYYVSSCLLSDGNMILLPYQSATSPIIVYNPASDTIVKSLLVNKGVFPFLGCTEIPTTGEVLCVPYGIQNIVIYNPTTNTYRDLPNHGKGSNAFGGCVNIPSQGRIILIPTNQATIGIYNY